MTGSSKRRSHIRICNSALCAMARSRPLIAPRNRSLASRNFRARNSLMAASNAASWSGGWIGRGAAVALGWEEADIPAVLFLSRLSCSAADFFVAVRLAADFAAVLRARTFFFEDIQLQPY